MHFFEHIIEAALALPRPLKRGLAVILDAGLSLVGVWVAFYLRVGHFATLAGDPLPAAVTAIVMPIPIFAVFGLYRTVIRYIGWDAAVCIVQAVMTYGLLYFCLFTLFGVNGVPRTIGIIQPILLFLAVAGSRAFARYWLGGGYRKRFTRQTRKNVAIYGAGHSGRQLASALSDGRLMKVIAFLDDDPQLQGSIVGGIRVWPPATLRDLAEGMAITDVLLAIPSADRRRRNQILEGMRPLGLAVRTLPSMLDLADGKIEFSDIRPLAVEDVLGRDPVAPDTALLQRDIHRRVLMVTGAGGSIGTELCRQLMLFRPDTLLLVEASEFALYTVNEELQALAKAEGFEPVTVIPLLASVCDQQRMRAIFSAWRPHAVYHAAAYKHVPLVEHNVIEGLRNNVIGTWTVATLAAEHATGHFTLVSTDKAVRPTNIMGASKRFAELAIQAIASERSATCFSMVRFGNVLGSSGSVLPLFRKQIKYGGPVTVTHREATRYFMTIPEAAQLVLQAGVMAQGGEVFVLDMGEPVKVLDLATRMIELSGSRVKNERQPSGDIEIVFTGLRPGEKLYEELLIGNSPTATDHARIMMAHEAFLPMTAFRETIGQLLAALSRHDIVRSLELLKQAVPEYDAAPQVVDWIYQQAKDRTTRALDNSPSDGLVVRFDSQGRRKAGDLAS